jgi:hypothetical protein
MSESKRLVRCVACVNTSSIYRRSGGLSHLLQRYGDDAPGHPSFVAIASLQLPKMSELMGLANMSLSKSLPRERDPSAPLEHSAQLVHHAPPVGGYREHRV